jgi:hypothetical protein
VIKPFGLLSNKQYNAVVILSIVREMISANHPELFRNNRKLDIVLHNGCRVITGNISTSCLRGRTIDVLLLDNYNLNKPEMVKDLFYCYIPVMACRINTEIGFILNTQEKISKENMNYIYSVYKK